MIDEAEKELYKDKIASSLLQQIREIIMCDSSWSNDAKTITNESFDRAIKALEQEPKIAALLEKTYDDFCKCEGDEGWMKIDGKEYSTDAGYALEGMRIFMEVFKRRLAESENKECL